MSIVYPYYEGIEKELGPGFYHRSEIDCDSLESISYDDSDLGCYWRYLAPGWIWFYSETWHEQKDIDVYPKNKRSKKRSFFWYFLPLSEIRGEARMNNLCFDIWGDYETRILEIYKKVRKIKCTVIQLFNNYRDELFVVSPDIHYLPYLYDEMENYYKYINEIEKMLLSDTVYEKFQKLVFNNNYYWIYDVLYESMGIFDLFKEEPEEYHKIKELLINEIKKIRKLKFNIGRKINLKNIKYNTYTEIEILMTQIKENWIKSVMVSFDYEQMLRQNRIGYKTLVILPGPIKVMKCNNN